MKKKTLGDIMIACNRYGFHLMLLESLKEVIHLTVLNTTYSVSFVPMTT